MRARIRPRDEAAAIGFAAALAGAHIGAWLGFHSATDLLALSTAIAGSVAGANLTLILLDIARARSRRERDAAGSVAPSTGAETVARSAGPA